MLKDLDVRLLFFASRFMGPSRMLLIAQRHALVAAALAAFAAHEALHPVKSEVVKPKPVERDWFEMWEECPI